MEPSEEMTVSAGTGRTVISESESGVASIPITAEVTHVTEKTRPILVRIGGAQTSRLEGEKDDQVTGSSAGEVKEDGNDGGMCLICRQKLSNLKRHVIKMHLPWYYRHDMACF